MGMEVTEFPVCLPSREIEGKMVEILEMPPIFPQASPPPLLLLLLLPFPLCFTPIFLSPS